MENFGRYLFYAGIALVLGGAVMMRFPGALNWFGKLPGDLRWGNGKVSVFVPLSSMLAVSVIVTLIANIIARLFPPR